MGSYPAFELLKAEQDWIKYKQGFVYCFELECLKCGTQIPKQSSLYKLATFLDENYILRVRSRLEQSSFAIDEINPVILPTQSKFTKLLILREHNKIHHVGVSATLAKIRNMFWIPKGRKVVKKVLKNCLICNRDSVKSAKQITTQLPKDRILENSPFTVSGVDFTGSVFLRSRKDTQQRSHIAFFTCGVTRALHI
ncbi:uncharacterized protein LOC118202554 [Stegodyphus dumicola]|uniref:uncharacterized protein LOC118202554 n=1 Tax=Stegodyphus dumicola TaxID=202533 RepID=UPI0015A88728|nr:uncharacterized protein LOC118202554 [Stegodyphus dumicola]